MLLILFVLLLVLAFNVLKKEEEISNSNEELAIAKNRLQILEEVVKKSAPNAGENQIEDLFDELVATRNENIDLKQKNEALSDEAAGYSRLREKIQGKAKDNSGDSKEKVENKLEEILQQAKKAEELEECAVDQVTIAQLAQENKKLKTNKDNLTGQLQHCVAERKGYGHPPCWVTQEGRIQPIYDVILRKTGLIIVDNKIQDRQVEQNQLPLSDIKYNQILGKADFLSQTKELYNWSVANECRFYANIIDETGVTDKLKLML
jgi:hypothetical protein